MSVLPGDARATMDASAWDELYSGEALLWSEAPNEFVAAQIGGLPPGRALDIACGEGRNTVFLAELGWEATGVDFSRAALAKAERLARAHGVTPRFLEADVSTFVPDGSAFDLVVVCYLHLPPDELRPVLERAAAALAAGGTLVVVGHDRENLARGVGGPRDPEILYRPEEIAASLGALEIELAEVVERTVETTDGPRVALDTLVRARRAS